MDTFNSNRLRIYFWVMLLINILCIFWMKAQVAPLDTNDIFRFEISRTSERATEFISRWKAAPPKFEMAVKSLRYDYLFIILYSTGLIVGGLYLARLSGQDLLVRCSKFISSLLVAGAGCDVIENLFLARMLEDPSNAFAVRMAYNFAAAKFSIIILALLFIAVCLIFFLLKRIGRQELSRG